ENYKWIFEQVGQMIAGMQGNIFYSDHIHFNTLVNLKTKEMKVIDFQIAHALNPADQVRILISGLDVGPDLKQTMLRIFEEAYSEGRTI
ncbi:MAG: DUF1679 domain-containing protein, partial [Candidatus Omnitrophica bacterium]|nr:DUF1679 domain-containing protein [Candidatus Omnitrophota bacterium]